MSLVNKIKEDQVKARKERNLLTGTLLTTLLGEVTKIGKDDGNRETTDAETTAVVKKFIKGIDETLKHLGESNPDASFVCQSEKAILNEYLPKQLTADEIKNILRRVCFDPATKGIMMSYLKTNYAGQYDGKVAAQAIDGLL